MKTHNACRHEGRTGSSDSGAVSMQLYLFWKYIKYLNENKQTNKQQQQQQKTAELNTLCHDDDTLRTLNKWNQKKKQFVLTFSRRSDSEMILSNFMWIWQMCLCFSSQNSKPEGTSATEMGNQRARSLPSRNCLARRRKPTNQTKNPCSE